MFVSLTILRYICVMYDVTGNAKILATTNTT